MKKRFVAILSLSLMGTQFVVSPSLFAADLRTIVQRNRLIVGVKDNVRPLGFRDAQGNLQGFEIEIAQRLAQELIGRSTAIEFQPVNNRDRLSVVTDERVDFAIARVTANSSRARIVAFSEPYYLDGTGIITQNAAIQTQRDLTNQTIAVLNNASTIATLRYQFPQVKLVGVESYTAGKQLIESGKAIAFAADVSILAGWAQEFPEYRVLPFRISTEPLAIVFPKGIESDELRRTVDQILRRWKSEGWLQQRATYWGLP
ncbi:MAG: transporter substrate-binding domain-containing protein [Phormidium tanganyikae FI6-MK23]|jgi:polar amino acid transport system substrate-binding protein|nr:transporter substrate-binding domain-containing protein [Phormidium tanganyikae FI6-MK23]